MELQEAIREYLLCHENFDGWDTPSDECMNAMFHAAGFESEEDFSAWAYTQRRGL
jgi:hypothetical protein